MLKVGGSDTYMSRMAGPRVRTLVNNLDELPDSVILPSLDKDNATGKEFSILYSGLPDQCDGCRLFGHLAKQCFKRKLSQNSCGKKQNTVFKSRKEPIRQEKPASRWTPNKMVEDGKKDTEGSGNLERNSQILDSRKSGQRKELTGKVNRHRIVPGWMPSKVWDRGRIRGKERRRCCWQLSLYPLGKQGNHRPWGGVFSPL